VTRGQIDTDSYINRYIDIDIDIDPPAKRLDSHDSDSWSLVVGHRQQKLCHERPERGRAVHVAQRRLYELIQREEARRHRAHGTRRGDALFTRRFVRERCEALIHGGGGGAGLSVTSPRVKYVYIDIDLGLTRDIDR